MEAVTYPDGIFYCHFSIIAFIINNNIFFRTMFDLQEFFHFIALPIPLFTQSSAYKNLLYAT